MRTPFASVKSMLLSQYMELAAAVRFLTVLPVPGSTGLFAAARPRLLIGSEYFPFVGLLLGLLLWLLALVFAPLVPPLVLSALLVVALVILTGGLHLDGLMDSCDGLFGGTTRERKLELMRDSRVGSFGVLGGACVLLLKFALLASLREPSRALFVTLPTARWAMVLTLHVFPSARTTGLGAAFRQTVTIERVMLAAITALAIVLVTGQLIGLIVWMVVTAAALVVGAWITRSLGGLTGDSHGAIEEVVEVVALLVLVVLRA